MRPFVLGMVSLGYVLIFTGCAVGLRAEAGGPAFALPSNPETVRVRILSARHPVKISCSGAYRIELREGSKSYSRHTPLSARAMRSAMVFGQISFKGEV